MDSAQLNQAISLARQGKKHEASQILQDLVWHEPENIQAWLWLADTLDSPAERLDIMREGLRQNPGNAMLQRAVNALAPKVAPPQVNSALDLAGEPPKPAAPRALTLTPGESQPPAGPAPTGPVETAEDEDWLRSLRNFSVDAEPAASSAQSWQADPKPVAQPQPQAQADQGDESVAAWLAELNTLRQGQTSASPSPAEAARSTPALKKNELPKPAAANEKSKPFQAGQDTPSQPRWMEPLKEEAPAELPMATRRI